MFPPVHHQGHVALQPLEFVRPMPADAHRPDLAPKERRFVRQLWLHLIGRDVRAFDRLTLLGWLGAMYLAGLAMPILIDHDASTPLVWLIYHLLWVAPGVGLLNMLLRGPEPGNLVARRRHLEITRALHDQLPYPATELHQSDTHIGWTGSDGRSLTLTWEPSSATDTGLTVHWRGPTAHIAARLAAAQQRPNAWPWCITPLQRPGNASPNMTWSARIDPPHRLQLTPGIQGSMASAIAALLIPESDTTDVASGFTAKSTHRTPCRRLEVDPCVPWSVVPAVRPSWVLEGSAAMAVIAVLVGMGFDLIDRSTSELTLFAQLLAFVTLLSALIPLMSTLVPALRDLATSWTQRHRLAGALGNAYLLLSPEHLQLRDGHQTVALTWARPWRAHLFRTGRTQDEGWFEITLRLYQEGHTLTLTTSLPETLIPPGAQRLDLVGTRMHPAEWLEVLRATQHLRTAHPAQFESIAALQPVCVGHLHGS
ncbi:MAG: hypothetical protein AAFS10_07315 [Myxococcota bacterium]